MTQELHLKPNIKRLVKALQIVLKRADDSFDLNNLFYLDVSASCGSVACVIGSCGVDPWFMSRGLVYDAEAGNVAYTDKQGDVTSGYAEASAVFFNISKEDASNLFCEEGDSAFDSRTSCPEFKNNKQLAVWRLATYISEHAHEV